MSARRPSDFSGNRFSLRARSSDQIKRIDSISNSLGAVGDFLVSTWGGIMMAVLTLGGGGFLVFHAVYANQFATLIQNIPAIILIVIGSILIALNVMMTNPSMGSQFKVSLVFLIKKFEKRSTWGKRQKIRPFAIDKNDPYKSTVKTMYKGRLRYMAVYQVRGSVSPVTFSDDLDILARLDRQAITLMERDTVLSTVNGIQTAKTAPKRLPRNATPAMRERRDKLYEIASNLPHNQQLKTLMIVNSPNLASLRAKTESIEKIFDQNLVVGYVRLDGKDLKSAFFDIFG